jgi:hypothetical protein
MDAACLDQAAEQGCSAAFYRQRVGVRGEKPAAQGARGLDRRLVDAAGIVRLGQPFRTCEACKPVRGGAQHQIFAALLVVVHDYGDQSLVFEVRGLKTGDYKGSKIGVIFEGTDGYAVSPSYDSGTIFDKDGNKVQSYSGGGDHFGNFVTAVRSRKIEDLNADILEGHLSSALCHLGNISYRMGDLLNSTECLERMESIMTAENVKATMERFLSHLKDNNVQIEGDVVRTGNFLKFDPKTEKFVSNEKADTMLTREYRAPFVVPDKV